MILVTGATGFVGHALVNRLISDGSLGSVVATSRRSDFCLPAGVRVVQTGDFSQVTNWKTTLNGIDQVIHCAARVHVMHEDLIDPLQTYRAVNVIGTLNLAKQAAESGVRRFVFVSSIKVNGETTCLGEPFTADQVPAPVDPYGVSKFEAEQGLRELEIQSGMEVVIVRPPLVYGPGVKANFAAMMRWVAWGIPLPLGAIYNRRSMVSLDNLVDLLVTCLRHPAAAGQTFLAADGEDVSTSELLRRTARAMDRNSFLLPVPVFALQWGGVLLGKRAVVQRLCGSLQVDIEKNRRLLGWIPPQSLDQGLKKAVEAVNL